MISARAGRALKGAGELGPETRARDPIPGSGDVTLTRERQGRDAAFKEKAMVAVMWPTALSGISGR